MSWGFQAWGFGAWGVATATALSIANVHARSETSVRVTLTRGARAVRSTATGDALNPRTWRVVRSDGLVYVVLSVADVPAAVAHTVFELLLLQQLGPAGVTHTLSSSALVDPEGLLITAPKSVDFEGCAASVPVAALGNDSVDLAKPQIADGMGGAVFTVGTAGDYDVEAGMPLLRKLFVRRLTTATGGFVFLPGYGLGIRLKAPFGTADLSRLKAEAQRQLALEPEVERVQVSLRMSSDGVLRVMLAAKLVSSGSDIRDAFDIQTSVVV